MAKSKRTKNDLQNITHQPKYRATRTPLKTEGELRCSGSIVYHIHLQPYASLLIEIKDNTNTNSLVW